MLHGVCEGAMLGFIDGDIACFFYFILFYSMSHTHTHTHTQIHTNTHTHTRTPKIISNMDFVKAPHWGSLRVTHLGFETVPLLKCISVCVFFLLFFYFYFFFLDSIPKNLGLWNKCVQITQTQRHKIRSNMDFVRVPHWGFE